MNYIGFTMDKENFDNDKALEVASWCNETQTATWVERDTYYECIAVEFDYENYGKGVIARLKKARDEEELSPIEFGGYRWDFDDKAQQRISGAITVLEATDASFTWTSADNEEIPNVTADILKQVVAAAAARSNGLHVKYRVLKAAVEDARTKAEMDEIKW